nr:hypothetical protein BaRGS_030039 [Batillaria attramentaria]
MPGSRNKKQDAEVSTAQMQDTSLLHRSLVMIDESAARALHRQVRVLCWIQSTEKQLNSKVRAVNDTWVKRCDGHVFFVDTQHHNASSDVIELGVKDGRGHLTEKSVAALAYVYEKYGKDYDWFLKGDDDAYVVLENLKFLLSHYNPNTPVYLGHLYKWHLREGAGTSGQADPAEEVGLDWTHPQEASIQHHTPSPDMEPTGEKEERPASQQLEAGH